MGRGAEEPTTYIPELHGLVCAARAQTLAVRSHVQGPYRTLECKHRSGMKGGVLGCVCVMRETQSGQA